jgi:protein DGCR14
MSQRRKKPTEQSDQRRLVLSEEEYTSTLSSIVQRDFFPDLPDLERQVAVLDRRSKEDHAGAVAVRRAARALEEHEEALQEQEEEDENDLSDELHIRKRARSLQRETLTGFHARATNEDDDEFDSEQKKQVQANRERLETLFRPTGPSQTLPRLTMASDQFQGTPNRIAASEWNAPKVRNGLFFVPTPQIKSGQETDPTLLTNGEGSESEANHLLTKNNGEDCDAALALTMPPPARVQKQNVVMPHSNVSVPKHALVEYIPKHLLEKKIEPAQTRFPPRQLVPFRPPLAPPRSESDTDGFSTDASTDLDAPELPIEHERRSRSRKDQREQESFVNMTPLVIPGAGNETPIMTWGTVSGTPVVLSGQEVADGGSQTFSLPDENERDRAAQKAQSELERRAKRAESNRTPSKRTASATARRTGAGSLTPAAMSLLEKTKRTGSLTPTGMSLYQGNMTPSRSRDAFASALRSSYTPQPRRGASQSRQSSSRDHAYKATPLASRNQPGNQTPETRK